MARQYTFDIVANTGQVASAINQINSLLTNLGNKPVNLKVNTSNIASQLSAQKFTINVTPVLNNKNIPGLFGGGNSGGGLFGGSASRNITKGYQNVRRLIKDSERISQNIQKNLPTYTFQGDADAIGRQWKQTTRQYAKQIAKYGSGSQYGAWSQIRQETLEQWNEARIKRNVEAGEYYAKQVDSLQKTFDKNYNSVTGRGYGFSEDLQQSMPTTIQKLQDLSNLVSQKKNWDSSSIQDVAKQIQSMGEEVNSYANPQKIMMNPSTLSKYISKINRAMQDGVSSSTRKVAQGYIEQLESAVNGESGISQQNWRSALVGNIENTISQMQRESSSGSGFIRRLRQSASGELANFAAQFFSTQDLINYGKQMAQATTQVDSALTELRKVSNVSPTRLAQSQSTSAQTAQQYGTTVSDAIQSTSAWVRLGNSIDDAEKLAKISAQFIAVGDDMDQESVETTLTSVQRAWNKTPEQLKTALDSINQVRICCPLITKDMK